MSQAIVPELTIDNLPSASSIEDEKTSEKEKEENVAVSVREVDNFMISEGDYTEEEYARLVKKIDRYLLPLMWWRYGGGLVLTVPAALSVFLAWSLLSSNVAGRTKKTVCSSITFIGSFFQAKDAPQYLTGLIVCAAAFVVQLLVLIGWRLWYGRKNRLRDEAALAAGLAEEDRERLGRELGSLDTTDGNNPHFRYTL